MDVPVEYPIHLNIRSHPTHAAPISRLPFELVSTIFEALRDDKGFLLVKQVVRLSHVCQFWRDSALSTPALWTTIELKFSLATEYLIRSQSLPLRLLAYTDSAEICYMLYAPDSASWVQSNAHRVQMIYVEWDEDVIIKLFDILGDDLPSLSSLVLYSFDNTVPVFTLFAPKLRILDITNVTTNFDAWKDLIHLQVASIPSEIDLDLHQLLALIKRSPGLQELHLLDIRVDAPDAWLLDMEAVVLPHLSILRLNYLLPELVTFFLSHISIPSSSPLVNSSPLHPYYLVIDFSMGQFSIHRSHHDTLLDINELKWDIISIIPVLTESIDMSLIRNLRAISQDDNSWREQPSNPRDWTTIFEALSFLTDVTIRLMACCIRSALQVLNPDELSGVILCPKLARLHLTVNGFTVQSSESTPLDRVVVDCLKARSRHDLVPLKTLVMNFGEDSVIDELKGIVRQVIRQ